MSDSEFEILLDGELEALFSGKIPFKLTNWAFPEILELSNSRIGYFSGAACGSIDTV